MSRVKSYIPRLKPAASYGNLLQLSERDNRPKSHHGSTLNLSHNHGHSPSHNHQTDRAPMITGPVPVTHRRMFHQYYSTRPPWATDDTISPFDKESDKITQSRRTPQKTNEPVSDRDMLQSVPARIESPSPSLDYTQASLPRDEFDGHNSFYENESYRSEGHRPSGHQRQMSAGQTDMAAIDWNEPHKSHRNKSFHTVSAPHFHKTEKRIILPLKELKRTNYKNNSGYKTNERPRSQIDFDRGLNGQERMGDENEDDVQARIDYWLNRNIGSGLSGADRQSGPNHRDSPVSPVAKTPTFRNQITFTPRPIKRQFPETVNTQQLASYSSTPQIIEAVIFQSDSESDKEYIVSSRSLENKFSRNNSHFTIRANLASKSKSLNNEVTKDNMCTVCGLQLLRENQMKDVGVRCHKDCFKCFWCKKRLSLENYKINSDKLCCPLHYRLVSN